MTKKTYTMSIYKGAYKEEPSDTLPDDLRKDYFSSFKKNERFSYNLKNVTYELSVTKVGKEYKGCIRKYCNDPLPHAGKPGGRERELEIGKDELTIERCHFLYFPEQHILVWQENSRCGDVSKLSLVLSKKLDSKVSFDPVLTSEEALRHILESHPVKAIEYAFARPEHADFYKGSSFAQSSLQLLNDSGSMLGSFILRANKRGTKGNFYPLNIITSMIDNLKGSKQLTKLHITLEDISHPIDLFANRLKDKKEVEMNGKYPIEADVYFQLQAVKDQFQKELNYYFGL